MKTGLLIAIDFDGTCVKHEYPLIGADIGAVPVLKKLVAAGHTLILWTMRSGDHHSQASEWFAKNGIKVSSDAPYLEQQTWTSSSKLFAHLYIDDAALGIPLKQDTPNSRAYVDWGVTEEMLKIRGCL